MPGSTTAQSMTNTAKFDEKKAYAPQEKEGEAYVGSPVDGRRRIRSDSEVVR